MVLEAPKDSMLILQNPANGATELSITLEILNSLKGIRIHDFSGKLVKRIDYKNVSNGNGIYEIFVGDLSNGIYHIYTFVNGRPKPMVKKLVVQN